MIDRVCPKCYGKAAPTVFTDERGRFAKLWECRNPRCKSVWGVPTYGSVARDLEYDYGLRPWTEPDSGRVVIPEKHRPAAITALLIIGALALFLRHWL